MKRILIVESDRTGIDELTSQLSAEGHSVQVAGDAEGAMHKVKAWKPHLILLDAAVPGISPADLIPRLRSAAGQEYVGVILLSAATTAEAIARELSAGADEHLGKPVRPQDLGPRVRAMLRFKEVQDHLRRANERIEELTATDELTGLLSFRTLFRRGEEEVARAKRFRKPVSALIVNLDGFSEVNREHGFQFGTQVLVDVGKRLKGCIRGIDMVARIGADEYFLLLTETDLAGAEFVAERVRDTIKSQPYQTDRISARLTACIGVAGITSEQPEARMADLLRSASEALRSAKAAGPDHLEIYSFA